MSNTELHLARVRRELTIDPARLRLAGKRVQQYRMDHPTLRRGRHYPMTQIALADKAGVSVGCLQGFETGTRITRPDQFQRIAQACDLTVEQLLAEAPAPAPPSVAASPMILIDEAHDIAQMFMLAHTEVRLAVKTLLREHFAQRSSDPAAQALVQQLATSPHSHPARPEQEGQPSPDTGPTFRRAVNGGNN